MDSNSATPTVEELKSDTARYISRVIDSTNKLAYSFWIVFLSGFVLSLRAPTDLHCISFFLLALFRVLAIIGTALNFLGQSAYLQCQNHVEFFVIMQRSKDIPAATTQLTRAQVYDGRGKKLLQATLYVAAAYLLLGLILSFVVHVSAN